VPAEPTFGQLCRTMFLEVEAVALEMTGPRTGTVHDGGCFDAILTRTLEIGLEPNPSPAQCAAHSRDGSAVAVCDWPSPARGRPSQRRNWPRLRWDTTVGSCGMRTLSGLARGLPRTRFWKCTPAVEVSQAVWASSYVHGVSVIGSHAAMFLALPVL
jgi:hypothetical protein